MCVCVCVCDRVHRDARWTGGLSHQNSDLSHLFYPLQQAVVHVCSDTGLGQSKVVTYLPTSKQLKLY